MPRFAFALTGIGTALLGSTLPAIQHQAQLQDGRTGVLLLAAWGGSTLGALLARGRLERSAAGGLALSGGALLGMAHSAPSTLLTSYFLFGLGLGATMTSISLLLSRGVSTRVAGAELNRLNLLWAAGACCAPLLALHSLRALTIGTLFRFGSAIFFGCALLLWFSQVDGEQRDGLSASLEKNVAAPRLPWAPLSCCVFAAASVGLESAIGSWLTTYTERSTATVGLAVSANAGFWIGLLVSRAVHSIPRLRWFGTRSAFLLHLLALALGMALLLYHPAKVLLASAGLLCGWGLGPLYPLVLAISLPRYRSTLIFLLAGAGASVVPWSTGALSSALGSLRLGLLAPVATLVLLGAATISLRNEFPGETEAVR